MASPDPTKLRIAGNGAIWKAPVGSTAPTDSTTALNAAFINVGYATDGFTVSQEVKTKDIEVWQSVEVARQLITGINRTVQWESVESNNATVSLAWGGATITAGTAGAYTMSIPSSYLGQEFAFVFDATDGTTSTRIYIPRATLNGLPKVVYGRQDVVKYMFDIQILLPTDGSAPVQFFGKDTGVAS